MATFPRLFQLFCFLCVIFASSGLVLDQQTSDPEVLQIIVGLQAEVASMKEKIRVLELQVNNTRSNNLVSPLPAFLATLGNSISNCNDRPLIFDNVQLNEGSYYDVRHGLFRAPRNGTYHFAATFSNPASKSYHVHLVKNNPANDIGYLHLEATNGWTERSTNVLVKLVQGDDVWLQCSTNSNSYIQGGGFHSHFSGFYLGQ